ncbi:MAG: hypothetical protein LBL76_05180 [Treponema sp.]|nr:hypothetical protein [Treponema sp.]
MANKFVWKLPLMTVVVWLALSSMSCASLGNMLYQGAETAPSKSFLDGANDILT